MVGRMSVVSLSVTILRPVGDVFAVLTDVGNAARWSSALEHRRALQLCRYHGRGPVRQVCAE